MDEWHGQVCGVCSTTLSSTVVVIVVGSSLFDRTLTRFYFYRAHVMRMLLKIHQITIHGRKLLQCVMHHHYYNYVVHACSVHVGGTVYNLICPVV